MKYSDFIYPNKNFRYSINLKYDLNNISKIDSYIPTVDSVDILNKYFKSIFYEKNDRASVLIGPYGKGKSHLLLVLLVLISLNTNSDDEKELIKKTVDKIEKINKNTAYLIKRIRKSKRKFIPVIIDNNYDDLRQAILIALNHALNEEKINKKIIPNTYFNEINKTIEKWEKNFPNAFHKFEQILNDNYKISFDKFKKGISKYNEIYYKIFKKIHPMVTSGTEFNPIINSDIVNFIAEINRKLYDTGRYFGLFIVFDEFSKFLESGKTRNDSSNLKIIQDIAELTSRTGIDQIHFACVTHKDFDDYILKLPKIKFDEWKAVEGRFTYIYFTSSSQQNYKLISNAIKKDETQFDKFYSTNKLKFEEVAINTSRIDIFKGIKESIYNIVKECFPLNPISMYSLVRVSEKVAQNERTMFTFLSKNEKASLVKFINKDFKEINWITLDWIYDYFQVLFEKETFNSKIHKIYLKVYKCLKKTNSSNSRKIIKAMAIIYIVNDFKKLPPTNNVLLTALNLNYDQYSKAIKYLLNKHIILKNMNNQFYRFSLLENIDLDEHIKRLKNSKLNNINIKEFISDIVDLGYILPKRYNDEKEMTRFFKNVFVTFNELNSVNSCSKLLDMYKCDGLVLYLLYFNETEKKNSIDKLIKLKDKRLIMLIPNESFKKQDEIKKYVALNLLEKDKNIINSDEYIEEELKIYKEDLQQSIKNYVDKNYDTLNNKCTLIDCNGKRIVLTKSSYISKKISNICFEVYGDTPELNNELINKMKISGPIIKARKKVMNYILNDVDSYPVKKLEGRGPEVTIFRALIENKNLLNNKVKEEEITHILNKIDKFILKCEENKVSFSKLYKILYYPPYGLRPGVIPIYLAFKFKDRKDEVILYFKNKEIELTSDNLDKINSNPKEYYLFIEKGSKDKDIYLEQLYNTFFIYCKGNEETHNKFLSIVEGMQNWIYSLPKYTREYNKVFKMEENQNLNLQNILFRKELLKIDINAREFLINKLPNKILKVDYKECVSKIISIKKEFDQHINYLIGYLVKFTKDIFYKQYNGSLRETITDWYNKLETTNKKFVYDNITNNILAYIQDLNTHNDEEIINELAYIITGLSIQDWNDDKVIEFKQILEKSVRKVEIDKGDYKSKNEYKIICNINNKNIQKVFKEEPISNLGQTLFNEIEEVIDEYGDSLDENQKRNILMKIIGKLI